MKKANPILYDYILRTEEKTIQHLALYTYTVKFKN